jgi:hypothetical protein
MMAMTEQPWRKSKLSSAEGGCVEMRRTADDGVEVRDSKDPAGPVLSFTAFEWEAFLDGARKGEFDS